MDGRPSAWYAGLGLGLFAAGVLLAPVAVGWWPVAYLPLPFIVGLACLGAVPFWEWATWPKADNPPPDVEPVRQFASASPVVLRRIRINDRTGAREIDIPERRPARWVAWQTCIEATLDWAQLRGGITSGVMVGTDAMFSDRGQWVDVTNVMAAAGLCEKANGRVTRLAGSVVDIRARVREGRCEWPVDREPPAYSPAPLSVGAEMVQAG